MSMRSKRLLLIGVAAGLGWWLGEDDVHIPAIAAHVALAAPQAISGAAFFAVALFPAIGAGLVLALLSWQVPHPIPRGRVVMASLPFVAAVGSFLVAAYATSRAFNECVEHGEEVRAALVQYRLTHGTYPRDLAALSRIAIPGRRLLHPNLLRYRSDGTTYELSFRDFLVVHQSTDKAPFLAVE